MQLLQDRPKRFAIWDAFCGGGGTAAGASRVRDVEIAVALNHDKIAIASHAANFPNTLHEQVDITKCDVKRYLQVALPFLLWASPECKYQGYSSGVKNPILQLSLFNDDVENPAHSQSRLTMNQVTRFAREAQATGHTIPYIAVENVLEVVRWHKFSDWETELRSLGYTLQFVNLNARFLDVLQSRDACLSLALIGTIRNPICNFSLRQCAIVAG